MMELKTSLCLGVLATAFSTGCTFTLPDPPTASVRILPAEDDKAGEFSYQKSPFAASLADAAPESGKPSKLDLVDAAWHCEVRMQWLRTRLRDDRGVQLALGLIGVTVSASTGVLSAALSNENGDAKTVLAATAALGAVVAGISQFVASPDTLVMSYTAAAQKYTTARSLTTRSRDDNGKIDRKHLADILDHLLACANDNEGDGSADPKTAPRDGNPEAEDAKKDETKPEDAKKDETKPEDAKKDDPKVGDSRPGGVTPVVTPAIAKKVVVKKPEDPKK